MNGYNYSMTLDSSDEEDDSIYERSNKEVEIILLSKFISTLPLSNKYISTVLEITKVPAPETIVESVSTSQLNHKKPVIEKPGLISKKSSRHPTKSKNKKRKKLTAEDVDPGFAFENISRNSSDTKSNSSKNISPERKSHKTYSHERASPERASPEKRLDLSYKKVADVSHNISLEDTEYSGQTKNLKEATYSQREIIYSSQEDNFYFSQCPVSKENSKGTIEAKCSQNSEEKTVTKKRKVDFDNKKEIDEFFGSISSITVKEKDVPGYNQCMYTANEEDITIKIEEETLTDLSVISSDMLEPFEIRNDKRDTSKLETVTEKEDEIEEDEIEEDEIEEEKEKDFQPVSYRKNPVKLRRLPGNFFPTNFKPDVARRSTITTASIMPMTPTVGRVPMTPTVGRVPMTSTVGRVPMIPTVEIISTLNNGGKNGAELKQTRVPWTEDELYALIEGLELVKGPQWSAIKRMFPDALSRRTPFQLKDKARNEIKRRRRVGENMGPFEYLV
ncbi:hypothetical protein BDF14DRAFT_1851539 [Spinellus fusiger]|nr:hypothetical protein BDF14DRAFT_1851539 [Spinellus fusiger]